MAYPIVKNTLGIIFSAYIKRVDGIGNVPKNGPYIIAANHSSYMDHLIVQTFWARRFNKVMHFLAKKEHFDSLHQRIWHTYVGAIPLDREKGGKKAISTALAYLKKGKIIAIYPEGTRTLDGKLQRAHTGVARLALNARVPVIPVGLKGTFEILPKGKNIPKFKRAVINIGKPIRLDDYYGKENNKKTLRLVTTKIMKEIARLAGQKYNFN